MRDPLEKRYERRRKWVLVPAALAVFSSLHLCSAIGWGATAAQTFDPRDADSIGKFLESLAPRREAEVTKLIEEMSSDQFIARQNAVRELAKDHHLDEFRPTQLDGFVRFAATSQCVWSHPLRFQNYRLRLEWRFPGDGLSDSGIALVKFPGEVPQEFMKWVEKDSLEVQLFRGRSGNLFAHGSKIQVGGEWLDGISSEKFYPDNELPGWNQLEIEERDGRLRVFINGILQNEATELARNLTSIGLRSEGFPVDFRQLTLEPLPGARVDVAAPEQRAKGGGDGS